MGDIISQLKSLENDPIDNPALPPELLANSVTTFMVRGLFLNIEFPYAYFPSRKVAGYMLYEPLWEGVMRLEQCGFKVMWSFIWNKKINMLAKHVTIGIHVYELFFLHFTGDGMYCRRSIYKQTLDPIT